MPGTSTGKKYLTFSAGIGRMMMREMSCPEKQSLQEKCASAWVEYEAAKAVEGLRAVALDPRSGLMMAEGAAQAARLRWKHLQASSALSRHLSRHRC